MKSSIQIKLDQMFARFEEISQLLAEPSVIADSEQFKRLSKEYAQLEPLANCYQSYQATVQSIKETENMVGDDSIEDKELLELAIQELTTLEETRAALEEQLYVYLIPKDPEDERNVYLEIRAGAGGDEAAIFAGDLFRMYYRYGETQGWQMEIVSSNAGEHGGYKEVIVHIQGQSIYSQLKFESGAHRVQRVPATESQGRVHTSTCTVAVLPEVEAIDAIDISPDELRIDTYRASGAGGQHVNKTDSAIRITHLPTGIVVECQDERSQHKNRAKALTLLKTRLLDAEQTKQRQQEAATRKSLVGTGDRSERIRTYNFPQGRLTDHRVNLTLYQLNTIMEGDLTPVIGVLQREYQAALLAELNQGHHDDD